VRKFRVYSLALSVLFAFIVLGLHAQDEPQPKPKPKPAATAPAKKSSSSAKSTAATALAGPVTLVVICDLDCTWKLDGETQRPIVGGTSAKVSVQYGEHLIEATTADGRDSLKVDRTWKDPGQSILQFALKPVTDKRVTLERGFWIDPDSKLMWAAHDSGRSDLTYRQAAAYCQELSLAGYTDWRLPARSEIEDLERGTRESYFRLDNMRYRTSTIDSDKAYVMWKGGKGNFFSLDFPVGSALCVRRSGE